MWTKNSNPRNSNRVCDMFLITIKIVFWSLKLLLDSSYPSFVCLFRLQWRQGDATYMADPMKEVCSLQRHKRLILKYQEHHDYYF